MMTSSNYPVILYPMSPINRPLWLECQARVRISNWLATPWMDCTLSWAINQSKLCTVILPTLSTIQVEFQSNNHYLNSNSFLIEYPTGLEKWIGYNDVKFAPTYFYVQKNSSFFACDTPISFEVERINTGNAMDLSSGIFTAPQTGVYHFSFTGMASFPTSWTFVYLGVGLYVNGNRIGMGLVEESNTVVGQNSQLTLQSTLNLNLNDQIWLEIYYKSNSVYLYDASYYHYTHFTGWMMWIIWKIKTVFTWHR